MNRDLPHELKSDDIFMTVGCCQGIETMIQVLSSPKSNILLSSLVYPLYHSYAIHDLVEIRKYELLPDQDWEIDLQSVEAIADHNTVAMVICNPHNPCGNVYTYHHLKKVKMRNFKLIFFLTSLLSVLQFVDICLEGRLTRGANTGISSGPTLSPIILIIPHILHQI